MKAVFSLLGLVVVLAVIGLLAKKQLVSQPMRAPRPGASAPLNGTLLRPSQQIQQDVKNAIEGAMQPRPMPSDSQ